MHIVSKEINRWQYSYQQKPVSSRENGKPVDYEVQRP